MRSRIFHSHKCIRKPFVRSVLLVLSALCVLGTGGCIREVPVEEPVRWELSDEARQTYALLLLEQSMGHNDLEGVLEASSLLLEIETRPQPFVDAASWLVLNKYNHAARELLEKAVQKLPDDMMLHLLFAESLAEQGEGANAIDVLQEYSRTHPDSDLARQELGILYARLGQYYDAERVLSSLPKTMRTPFVRYAYARALRGVKRPLSAIRELRVVVQESPEFLEAWFELASLLEQEKKYSEASEIYASLLEQDPDNEDVWTRFVDGEIRAGRGAHALKYVHGGPETFEFRIWAANMFMRAGLLVEAESILQEIFVWPGAPEDVAFYLGAIAYEQHKDSGRALELLSGISEQSEVFERSLKLRIYILHDLGEFSRAQELVRKGLQLYPQNRDFYFCDVQLCYARNRFDEAMQTLELALELWPDDADFMYQRGSLMDSMGRKDEAFRFMEDLVAIHPDSAFALNYIGYSLAENGHDLDRAVALLERAEKLAPDKGSILDSLAWAKYRKGEFEAAWDAICRAVALPDGNDPTVWDHYGDIAAALGRKDDARRGWRKAMELNPPHPDNILKKLETP